MVAFKKELVQQANETTGAISDLFQEVFNSNNNNHIIYRTQDFGYPQIGANTRTDILPIVTTFNTWRLENSTDLDIVKTTIHEMIHATLIHFWRNPNNNYGDPNNTDPTYIELINAFNQHRETYGNTNQTHHEYMTGLITQIGDAIETWADANGYDDLDPSYFDKLAWGGLEDINNPNSSFNTNNTEEQKDAITNAIDAEIRLTAADTLNTKGTRASTINCD